MMEGNAATAQCKEYRSQRAERYRSRAFPALTDGHYRSGAATCTLASIYNDRYDCFCTSNWREERAAHGFPVTLPG